MYMYTTKVTIAIEMSQRFGTARVNFEYINITIRKFLSSTTLTLIFKFGQRSGLTVFRNTLHMHA